ncbi:MAG: hypothetical protein K9H49_17615 [Bacteroidales bacterium]|nr:hypothetical protein [Bacteroidales bacterium]MCF8404084.1 hypothetical protein [Bacteroidales bacterium]
MKRFAFFLFALSFAFGNLISQTFDTELFKSMRARNIGPGGMSGRVTTIDVQINDPSIIWVGTASGGLWKSESGGVNWEPVFDKEKVAGIGALAIDQKKPDVIWVGTGEGNPRNSVTGGYGLYKSLDGGRSWKLMGLENTRHIHRIIVNPENSDIVYVGALGSPWGPHKERGVYKTIDGGKTWEQILFVNESTGVADMIMDPSNPDKLFVAMWEHDRDPWFFKSGGKGSGLHLTVDGGQTWEILDDKTGLPKGELGRMGLAISSSNPNYVYALVESKKNAIYRSVDGGYTWKIRGTENIGDRPFYYADIFVDPKNENRLYTLYSYVNVSEDGGNTFTTLIGREIHSDHHAWYIHPENPKFMIDGNDGGLAISYDMGQNWRHITNLPLSQFYHINYDLAMPYNVMGGMQDNGSWRGPGYVWSRDGIINTYWDFLMGGDGFDVVPVPGEEDICYAMSQQGYVQRLNVKTGKSSGIRPVHPDGTDLRFHWNAAIAINPFNNNSLYFGSQFVHKSNDRGDSWEIISPDLTSNDPNKQTFNESGGLTYDVTGAETHTTILAITPSEVNEDIIWVGTDDGKIQLTRDGGKTWVNTVEKLKDFPVAAWIPQITASSVNEAEAFAVVNNYRQNDYAPYLYYTSNYGKTWERLVEENDVWGYVLSFVQDAKEPNLMFLGTEYGLFLSIDKGQNWNQWKNDYPTVSTMDLKIHPREGDLIIGTFGRAAWVMDDIEPLRILAGQGKSMLEKTIIAFDPPTAVMANMRSAPGYYFTGDAYFEGENKSMGAMLSFYVKEGVKKEGGQTDGSGMRFGGGGSPAGMDPGRKDPSDNSSKTDSLVISIFDEAGKMVREIKTVPEPGMNRISWRFDTKGFKMPSMGRYSRGGDNSGGGPSVSPGIYTLKYNYKNDSSQVKLEVISDPRESYNPTARKEKETAVNDLIANIEALTTSMEKLKECKSSMDIVSKLATKEQSDSLKKVTKEMKNVFDPLNIKINGKENVQGIYGEDATVSAKLRGVYGIIYSDEALTPTQEIVLKQSLKICKDTVKEIEDFLGKEWKNYKDAVEKTGVSIFKE